MGLSPSKKVFLICLNKSPLKIVKKTWYLSGQCFIFNINILKKKITFDFFMTEAPIIKKPVKVKEVFRHFSSFLKDFQLPEIVSDLRVYL